MTWIIFVLCGGLGVGQIIVGDYGWGAFNLFVAYLNYRLLFRRMEVRQRAYEEFMSKRQ